MSKSFEQIKNFMFKTSKSPADMLFYTSVLAWVLGCLAQVFSISCNKKLSKKEKSFLIPQEIFDGFLNIGIYSLVTVNVLKFTKEKFKKNPVLNIKGDRYIAPAVTLASIGAGTVACNIVTPLARNYLGAKVQKQFLSLNSKNKSQQSNVDLNKITTRPYFKQKSQEFLYSPIGKV